MPKENIQWVMPPNIKRISFRERIKESRLVNERTYLPFLSLTVSQ